MPKPRNKDIRHLDEEKQGPYLKERFKDELERTDTSMDHLVMLGAKAGHVAAPHIDQAVVDWLREDISPGRADVVGSFLLGYWQQAGVWQELVYGLLNAIVDMRRQGNQEPSSLLLALHLAYKKGDSAIQTRVANTFKRLGIELRTDLITGSK